MDALSLPSFLQAWDLVVRLVVAAALGGALGFEREMLNKPAGLRTHMLVAMGAALFVLGSLDAGASPGDVTRVVQGIATGIGFVGAGAIIKREDGERVEGLTTAAGIWLTAAVGVAVGQGHLWVPVLGVVLALLVTSVLGKLEERFSKDPSSRDRRRSR